MGELLPCPFCGNSTVKVHEKRRGNYRREGDNYQAWCSKCRARGPLVQDNPASAASGWNTRTPDARITQLEAEKAELRKALSAALDHYHRNVCEHEETYRGGAIWTICTYCGAKWADDEGGFKPFVYPPEIQKASATLSRLGEEA